MSTPGARVSVTTSATPLNVEDPGLGQYDLLARNKGTASVDLGDASVTTGAGFELAPGEAVSWSGQREILHAVAATGTVRVDVLRVGVGNG